MKKRIWLCLLAGILSHVSNAQEELRQLVDSLNKIYSENPVDTTYVTSLITVLDSYNEVYPDATLPYYNGLVERIEGKVADEYLELSLNDLGVTYYYAGYHDSCVSVLERSYELAKEIDYSLSIERLSNLAAVYGVVGMEEKELEATLDVVRAAEEMDDSTLMLSAYNSLGGYYYYQEDFKTAIKYFEKAIEVGENGYDEEYLSRLYLNVGTSHERIGSAEKGKDYYLKALEISRLNDNSYDLSGAHISLGDYYANKGNTAKGKSHLNEAIRIADSLGYTDQKAQAALSLGALLEEEDIDRAIALQEEALEIYSTSGYTDQVLSCLNHLQRNYDRKGNVDRAYDLLKRKEGLKDSLRQRNKEEALADMRTKYETDKIQQRAKIDRLAADLKIKEEQERTEEQRFYTIISSAGVIVMLLTAFLLLRLNRIRKRANNRLQLANNKIEQQRDEIREINLNLTDSINYAKQIQDAILPSDDRLMNGLGDVFVYFRPRDVVSGDFYWYHETEDKAFLAAADCTGHGVPGAFVSMVCQSVLNKIVVEDEVHDPGRILSLAHEGVVSTFKKESTKGQADDGMDVALTVWDKKGQQLHYAGAMNPLVLVRGEQLIEIKADRRGIGGVVESEQKFKSHQLPVEKDDMIYLFSDGYQDQFGGPKGKKFMIKRLKQILTTVANLDLEEQKNILDETFRDWIGDQEQIDDVLLMGYRIG